MKIIRKWYPLWWLYRLYLQWHRHDVWQWAGWITPGHPLVKQKMKSMCIPATMSALALVEFVARIPWEKELGAPMHYPSEVLADPAVPRNCYGHAFPLASLLIAARANARCVKGTVYDGEQHAWVEWRIGAICWQVDTRQKPYMFILGSEGDKMGHKPEFTFDDLQVGN